MLRIENPRLFIKIRRFLYSERKFTYSSLHGRKAYNKSSKENDRRLYKRYTSSQAEALVDLAPWSFTEYLKSKNINRGFLIYNKKENKINVSHSELEVLGEFLKEDDTFKNHEAIFLEIGKRTSNLFGVFIHNSNRGQAHGGSKLLKYSTMKDYLREGLRLSFANGVKAALAGLWVSGGIGIIAEPLERKHWMPEFRQSLFRDYGEFLTSLNGCFIANEEFGVSVNDMNSTYTRSRYVTGISEDKGGMGSPHSSSGKGIICAMEAALDFLKLGTLKGKTIAVQGIGKIGHVVIFELLKKEVKHIYVTDCHQKQIDDAKDFFSENFSSNDSVEFVKVPIDDESIFSYKCDILSPCAYGNVLKKDSIQSLKAKIICGAANIHLESEEHYRFLKELGIVYVVDYLANRMGMVVSDSEIQGRLINDPAIERHFSRTWDNSIYVMTKKVLRKAKEENLTPFMAASNLAEEFWKDLHPVWPNRNEIIIEGLLKDKWHQCRRP